MIRVVLFEDNKSLRQSLGLYLASADGLFFCGAFPDANDALAKIRKHKPDVVLMDIQMPGISGIEALQKIKAALPATKVLMQTVYEDEHRVFAAICGGASGYVLKSPDPEVIVQAVRDVYNGGAQMSPTIAAKVLGMFQQQFVQTQPTYVDLTDREREVLSCMVKGMSYKLIADACCLSYHTVHWHVKNIYEKLHVNSAPEAVAKAIEGKLVS
ncbi:response regulator transcription factor [Fibrella forsythiae]|uniref:Response regulator transcription factor n=1 Tax=Fibrella forsythiae TaxID=2817061 RepID=A0ABS3JJV8_9BACT|nr:response regulator transcription factor [Fibrella forsythiae]MBO0950288.1 response regulator transcription factor [Fibrella forsythiae]